VCVEPMIVPSPRICIVRWIAIAALVIATVTTCACNNGSTSACGELRHRVEALGGTLTPTGEGARLELHFDDHPRVPLVQLAELLGNLNDHDCHVTSAGIWHHPLSGEIVGELCQHQGMKRLALVNAELTDRDVLSIQELNQLEVLGLRGSDLTRAPPLSAHAYGRMQLLDLSRNKLAEGCFHESQAMPRLTHLDLAGTRVGDDSLPFIEACESLELLDVAGCRLTEEAVPALSKLRKLKVLSVGGMGWSAESYLRLCELPRLEVLWIGLEQPQRRQVEEGLQRLGRKIILR
jgi:hypothetical protein